MASPAVSLRRGEVLIAALLALFFGAAATVGDVGSCGQTTNDLNPQSFASARKTEDCRHCAECKLTSQTCSRACDPNAPSDVGWPPTCRPLQHDGEVCLRALQAATCGEYAGFLNDLAPSVPNECDFCHLIPESGILLGD